MMDVAIDSQEDHVNSRATDFVMATQPIFSKSLDVFAHELLFRQCLGDECAVIIDFDDATNQIIADGFSLATKRLGQSVLVSVNVGKDNILSKNVTALPPGRVILEVPSDERPTKEFLAACEDLRKQGYRFLLDNFLPGKAGMDELLSLMDYVKVPVGGMDGKKVAGIRKGFLGWKGKLIASRIESWEEFEGCKFLGFDYFQGYFFSYPQDIVGKRLTSHKTSRLNLLRELSDENVELSRIVEIISTDQALSVRLLHFVNSAAFSLNNKVDSLGRAASLVGLNTIKKWAMTAVLSDLDHSGKGAELSYRTMHGAFFQGLLAEDGLTPGHEGETLFLLGLLCNVDALLGMKMKEIVESMPLKAPVKRALLRDGKEPLTKFVLLLDAILKNDWVSAQGLLQEVRIPLIRAANLYMQAGDRTQELLGSLTA